MNTSVNVREGAGGSMDNSLIIALDFANRKEVEKFFTAI